MTIEEKAKEYAGFKKEENPNGKEERHFATYKCDKYCHFIAGFKEATRWIPVEEKLPEEGGQYLVKHNNSIMLLWYNTFHECWDDADGDDFYCKPNEVTAWRPIEFE